MLKCIICKRLLMPGFERLEVSTARRDTVCTVPSLIHSIPGKLRTLKTNLLMSTAILRMLPKKIFWLRLKLSECRSKVSELAQNRAGAAQK